MKTKIFFLVSLFTTTFSIAWAAYNPADIDQSSITTELNTFTQCRQTCYDRSPQDQAARGSCKRVCIGDHRNRCRTIAKTACDKDGQCTSDEHDKLFQYCKEKTGCGHATGDRTGHGCDTNT